MNAVTRCETHEVFRPSTAITFAAIVGTAVVAAAYGCGSSSTTLLQPSNDRCAIGMPASPPPISASGGTGSVSVTAARECVWSVTSDASWLTITSDLSGQGSGTINFAVARNATPSTRRGALAVGGQRTEIVQSGAPCQFLFNPAGQSFDASGGDGTVAIDTMDGCAWTAASGAPWITITATQNTNGPGTVRFQVAANAGDARASAITIAGQPFAVTQAGLASPQCSFRIDPSSYTAPSESSTTSIAVAASSGCAWNASTQTPWITIVNGASGTGNGSVNLRFAANTGAFRVGTVTIANAIFTVTQAAALVCNYSLAPPGVSTGSGASNLTVAVTTSNGCAWTAASQASWITVSGGASGNGSGNVSLAIAANSGSGRSGTVTIGDQTFTVTQAAIPCTYSIAPNALSPPAAGADASVAVTAPAGCTWTAVSQAQWIAITNGASGAGNGTVTLTVEANGGAARVGTAAIAGQTYTVTQAAAPAPCAYTIAPTEQSVAAAGAPVTAAVTTTSGCAWSAVSQVPWVVVDRGAAGTGSGAVEMSVARNTGPARTGSVLIANQAFTVNQAAEPPPCTYALDPTTQAVTSAGGDFSVTINTQAGCAWTMTSTAPWITLIDYPSGVGSGVGSGSVRYRAAPNNTSSSRVGTLESSGQVLTITQAWPF